MVVYVHIPPNTHDKYDRRIPGYIIHPQLKEKNTISFPLFPWTNRLPQTLQTLHHHRHSETAL